MSDGKGSVEVRYVEGQLVPDLIQVAKLVASKPEDEARALVQALLDQVLMSMIDTSGRVVSPNTRDQPLSDAKWIADAIRRLPSDIRPLVAGAVLRYMGEAV